MGSSPIRSTNLKISSTRGIPVSEADDDAIAVVMRIGDLPVPLAGSSIGYCAKCLNETWVSPSTKKMLEETPMTLWCTQCAAPEVLRNLDKVKLQEVDTSLDNVPTDVVERFNEIKERLRSDPRETLSEIFSRYSEDSDG